MKKKIIIIGCGNMGMAHLISFLRNGKSYEIYIIEKNSVTLKKIKKFVRSKFHKSNSKLFYSKSFPSNKNYDFAIISTLPDIRYKITKKLVQCKKIKFLLLEKFVFEKKEEFTKMDKFLKTKKIKVFVNSWSSIYLNSINLKKKLNKKFLIKVYLAPNHLLTSFLHFYYLMYLLTDKKKIIIDFSQSNLTKVKYHGSYFNELNGKIKLRSINGSELMLVAKKNCVFNLKTNLNQNNYVNFNMIGKNIFVKSNIKKYNNKILDFPLASSVTSNFFQYIYFNKKKYSPFKLPEYRLISYFSKLFINLI